MTASITVKTNRCCNSVVDTIIALTSNQVQFEILCNFKVVSGDLEGGGGL